MAGDRRRHGFVAAASFVAIVCGTDAQAGSAADTASANSEQAIGVGQRIGAQFDAAAERAKAWLAEQSRAAIEHKRELTAHALQWMERGRSSVWGDASAGRVFEVRIAAPSTEPLCWTRWTDPATCTIPARLVLLVHGLDEPGGVWNDLAPALLGHGLSVARFDYPNDQHIGDSADMLATALADLHSRGVGRVDLVAHSMGGLVIRDVLTRAAYYGGDGAGRGRYPAVGRFIMLSTPHRGSILAKLEPISEAREHLCRRIDSLDGPGDGLLHSYADGNGEAAEDLCPGSAFLSELNARPMPRNVAITNIIGTIVGAGAGDRAARWSGSAAASMGFGDSTRFGRAMRLAMDGLGDGLVSASSADLPGVADTVRVTADHRGMLQRWWRGSGTSTGGDPADLPPAIPVIMDRLGRDPAGGRP